MSGLVRAALSSGSGETIVVLEEEAALAVIPPGAVVLLTDTGSGSASLLRVAIDYAARAGHDAIVVAEAMGRPIPNELLDPTCWRSLLEGPDAPVLSGTIRAARIGLDRLTSEVWPLVPLEGPLSTFFETKRAPVRDFELASDPGTKAATGEETATEEASEDDRRAVAEALGRTPLSSFRVVRRDRHGVPLVIENAPFLHDGTPMPTRYWLVERKAVEAVSRLESGGGVRRAEASIDPAEVAASHARYAALRDRAIGADHEGPRPSGGVGGTREGLKCLHAHLAYYLAGGADPVGRFVTQEIGEEIDGPVAAIDCGTNSTRLLVVAPDGSSLAREMIITRLGEGVDATGRLAPQAIGRTLEALAHYREVCDRHGVVRLRATATSAARDAANSEDLFGPATAALGTRPELIAGTEEGQLSYRGATAGLSDGPYLVVDVGGGSTELVAGSADRSSIAAVISLDIGCVRVTERFFASDPPSPDEIAAARAYVAGLLAGALGKLPALCSPKQLIGVAGTVSSLTSMALGLEDYDNAATHHARLSLEVVESLTSELAAMDLAARQERPGMEVGRADVIVGGAIVLSEVMKATGHDELICSETDILDGVAADLLDRYTGAVRR